MMIILLLFFTGFRV
jgi:hypothetical protein